MKKKNVFLKIGLIVLAVVAAVFAVLFFMKTRVQPPKQLTFVKQTEPQPSVTTTTNPGQNQHSGKNDKGSDKEKTTSEREAPKVYSCLNSTTWYKDSLEKEEDLKGLYDDLRKGNFERIFNVWCGKIDPEANPEWGFLIEGIKKQQARGKDVFKDFQLDSEKKAESFNIKDYIGWLKIHVDKKVPKNDKKNNPSNVDADKPKEDAKNMNNT